MVDSQIVSPGGRWRDMGRKLMYEQIMTMIV